MMNALNRRAALAGALAIPAASVAEHAKGGSSLAAIGLDLDTAIAADRAAWLAATDADELAEAEDKRLCPPALRMRPTDVALGICGINDRREIYIEADVNFFRHHFEREGVTRAVTGADGSIFIERVRPTSEAIARAREIVAAWQAWQSAIRSAGKRSAAERAIARAKATSDVVSEMIQRIAEMRAMDASDIAVKVKAMAWAFGVEPKDVASEISSLDRLAGPILASLIVDSQKLGA